MEDVWIYQGRRRMISAKLDIWNREMKFAIYLFLLKKYPNSRWARSCRLRHVSINIQDQHVFLLAHLILDD